FPAQQCFVKSTVAVFFGLADRRSRRLASYAQFSAPKSSRNAAQPIRGGMMRPIPRRSSESSPRRRTFRFSVAAALIVGAGGLTAAALAPRAEAGPPMTVGFIYVGPKTDYGYNQ